MDSLSIPLVGLIAGSAVASGVRLYATIAVLGFLGRTGTLDLPPGLHALTHPVVIGVAAALYLVEFIADKIPVLDSVWDVVHTFIRVPAGVLLGFSAFGNLPEPVRMIAALVCGAITLSAHGLKSGARAAINTSPEPVTNALASITEEGFVATLLYLAIRHPVASLVVAAAIIAAFLLLLHWIVRILRGFLRRLGPRAQAAAS
jgi:hypothetical protein